MVDISLAVLVTCFNRKQKTLVCLSRLFAQIVPDSVQMSVFLVDDGSTDGTAIAVRQEYPRVNVIEGNGNLFWSGGMRLAFDHAFAKGYDFYLWLNDDTFLYEDAVAKLLREFLELKRRGFAQSIVVGATQDPETGSLTYGGVNRYSWWYPLKFVTVTPGETAKQCDTMHGNCVLIPHSVAAILGNLDPKFVHHLSDFDYGFRATQQGCSVWLAPGFIGTCSYHDPLWREKKLSLKDKLKAINHPKGLTVSEWKFYAQRHAGPLWPIYWLSPYVKLIITSFFQVRPGVE